MIIIVEGIDRVGKTTVAKKISDEFGMKIFNNPYVNQEWVELGKNKNGENIVNRKNAGPWNMFANIERMNVLLSFNEQFKCEDFIADRFHMSEYVYGVCDRQYANLDAFMNIDSRLSKLGAVIVYVKPKDINWSSEQHGSDLRAHYRLFEKLVKITKCKVIKCNHDSLNSVVDKIKLEVNAL